MALSSRAPPPRSGSHSQLARPHAAHCLSRPADSVELCAGVCSARPTLSLKSHCNLNTIAKTGASFLSLSPSTTQPDTGGSAKESDACACTCSFLASKDFGPVRPVTACQRPTVLNCAAWRSWADPQRWQRCDADAMPIMAPRDSDMAEEDITRYGSCSFRLRLSKDRVGTGLSHG